MSSFPSAVLCVVVLAAGTAHRARAADPSEGAPAFMDDEVELTLDGAIGDAGGTSNPDEPRSFIDGLRENLRINVDFISRLQTTSRRGEVEALHALGLDMRKVFSDAHGDIGTSVLQPYLVRRDNSYMMPTRMIETDQDDGFSIELHDFYFDYTRWGRGRTNIRIGHFDVPFGLDPLVDTHFTVRQYLPMHDAGFKKDWGASLHGALPDFDYAISLTTGTGKDLTGLDKDPHLVAARIGTPSDANTVLGFSGLIGEVIDDHGAHRVDEGDPRGDFRQMEDIVRRWRTGLDATHLIEQWTMRAECSAGEDYGQTVVNVLGELEWMSSDETFMVYLQGRYNAQDGFLGWDEDVQSRFGLEWRLNQTLSLSAQWIHEFMHYAEIEGDDHLPEDTYTIQLRARF